MSWKGRFAIAGLLAVLFFALGLAPLFGPLLYTLTPLQRQYLLPYIASSWHRNDPSDRTGIRWMLKLKPEPPDPKENKKRGAKGAAPKLATAFAEERDLIAKPLPDRVWSGDALPFRLSEEAMREGWTGLTWGYPREVSSPELADLLREEIFGGRPWERYFLQPAVAVVSLLLLILMGRVAVQAWQDRRLWGRPLHRPEYLWRWMLASPKPKVYAPEPRLELQSPAPLTLAAPAPAPSMASPPGAARRAVAAAPEPVAKPSQAVPTAPVAAPVAPQPAFVWDESAGIE